jgi:hypothetical protein
MVLLLGVLLNHDPSLRKIFYLYLNKYLALGPRLITPSWLNQVLNNSGIEVEVSDGPEEGRECIHGVGDDLLG